MNEVILVDDNDVEIGTEEKLKAHLQGLQHRAFSVFVFNSKRQMLMQQRALSKYHSGGLWSNACCSHQSPGESTLDAAHRRLKEELGIDCKGLKEIFVFKYKAKLDKGITENEIDHILVGTCDAEPIINPDEVSDYKWIDPAALEAELKQKPQLYTFWLTHVWKEFYTKIQTENIL